MNKKEKVKKLIAFLKSKYSDRATASSYRDPFKVLVACVLSQRTKEENTARAATALFKHVHSPRDLVQIPLAQLEQLIRPAGFYRQKARRLKQIARVLLQKYAGKVPDSRPDLLKLPGVGDKTAAVVLCYGFGKPTIPVDVHVEIVAKRLGLVPADAKPPQIRQALEQLVPKADQHIVNVGLVHFGREVCTSRNPRCQLCPFKRFCLFYKTKIKK